MAKSGPKTKFTEEQIQATLEARRIVGTRAIARATGINRSTVHKWKKKEDDGTLDSFIEEKCPDSITENLDQIRTEKKLKFVELGWQLALKILIEMENKMPEATFKDLSVGFGIILDKILLATGEATSRTETIHPATSREDLLKAAQQVSEKVKSLPQRRSQQAE